MQAQSCELGAGAFKMSARHPSRDSLTLNLGRLTWAVQSVNNLASKSLRAKESPLLGGQDLSHVGMTLDSLAHREN